MKIYLFHPETGAYLGEDFADELLSDGSRKTVPEYATTIAPPDVERGMVPVFCLAERCWTIRHPADLRGLRRDVQEKRLVR